MLSVNEVTGAVKDTLEDRFPGETVYTNLTPNGFTRPSFLVVCGPVKMMDANAGTLSVSTTITVTAFVTVDDYHNSHIEALQGRMMAVLELFAVDGLRVGDRVLRLAGPGGVCNFDYAEINIPVQYLDDRPKRDEPWETMEDVALRTTPSA